MSEIQHVCACDSACTYCSFAHGTRHTCPISILIDDASLYCNACCLLMPSIRTSEGEAVYAATNGVHVEMLGLPSDAGYDYADQIRASCGRSERAHCGGPSVGGYEDVDLGRKTATVRSVGKPSEVANCLCQLESPSTFTAEAVKASPLYSTTDPAKKVGGGIPIHVAMCID